MALCALRTLQVVLKRSKLLFSFTLLSCSGVGTAVSCSLVPALASKHHTASMALTTTIGTGWFWSGNPVEYNFSTSHTNTKFPCLGYHNVCARQWQGYSPWVIEMFLRIRYPEAPVTVPLLSYSDVRRLFHQWRGIRLATLRSPSSSGIHSHYPHPPS